MTFQDYKLKEFKGDALAKFIAVELVTKYYPDCDRAFFMQKVAFLVSNAKFAEVARKLNLCHHKEDYVVNFDKPFKNFANAFEVKLWEVYEQEGLNSVIEFFKTNVMTIKESNLAVSDTSKA